MQMPHLEAFAVELEVLVGLFPFGPEVQSNPNIRRGHRTRLADALDFTEWLSFLPTGNEV